MRQLITVSCKIDDFCKTFEHFYEKYLIASVQKQRQCPAALASR